MTTVRHLFLGLSRNKDTNLRFQAEIRSVYYDQHILDQMEAKSIVYL